MNMRKPSLIAGLATFALLLLPANMFGQDKTEERGSVEFGVRYVWGDVYGRPDLLSGQCLGCGTPFDPSLKTSKYNEYRDLRNGFFIRKADLKFDNVLGSRDYVSLQSQKTLYHDQSYLASFGQYGKFKISFRYDEIPHTYTDTARTLFTETSPGVWSFPAAIRSALQASTAGNLPSLIAGTGANVGQGTVTNFNFITPSIIRKGGTALFSYNLTPAWVLSGSFWRENESGSRPIGLIMNSSPSATASSGFGVELPEPINYFNNLVRVGAEYGRHSWAFQLGYTGSFFQNDIGQLSWDNPFRLTAENTTNPLTGRMDLYPDNQAHYLNFAAASDLGKYLRVSASISPGWLRQNDAFLPYTTNTAILGCGGVALAPCNTTATLPAASLNGSKQTLAMNYNLVTTPWKNFQFKAGYRYYDYSNDTPVHTFTPTEGDAAGPGTAENTAFGFNRKNLEVTGNWFFTKKSSLKVGYEGEWMDRSHRDVEHSLENSIFAAVDLVPIRDLLIRVSYRHSDRTPDAYQNDASSDPVTLLPVPCTDTTNVNFTNDQRCHRRFDESARLRNRADGLVQYSPTDKLTFSAFGGTLQDDFNRAGGSNSPVPLNFLTGGAATTSPYFLYGVLKDISYNYGFDADYAVSVHASLFLEYSHERYHKRIISRNRSPISNPVTILTCNGCDSANNDWESVSREPVDIWSAGADLYLGKKAYITTYYSLSAAKGNVFTHPLGNPTILAGANAFTLIGTNSATDYPETVNRNHEVAVIFKYKLTKNLMPKLEYRYQQWDNKDYQTSPMTQYMGCVSAPPPAAPIAGCNTPILNSATSPNPVGVASPFYPYFVVGDPSAARYLFLGTDQPSYRAHYLAATLEYHF
jgi:MtrB/PioB family decaheme-associated outer membrane protein